MKRRSAEKIYDWVVRKEANLKNIPENKRAARHLEKYF